MNHFILINVNESVIIFQYVQTTNGNLLAFPFKFHGKQFIELEEPPKDEEDEVSKLQHVNITWLHFFRRSKEHIKWAAG